VPSHLSAHEALLKVARPPGPRRSIVVIHASQLPIMAVQLAVSGRFHQRS